MTRVFIIASGPSLEGFDFKKLDNELTIGINYIFRYYTPSILHWLDEKVYLENNHKQIVDKLNCLKVTKYDSVSNTYNVYALPISPTFQGKDGLSKGLYHRFLTGLTAISLAIALDVFDEIYLLGYDGQFKDKKGHFYHQDFQHKGDSREHVFKQGVTYFNKFSDLKNIYNCSPISLIKVFPFKNIDQVLAEKHDTNKAEILDQIRDKLIRATVKNMIPAKVNRRSSDPWTRGKARVLPANRRLT
jgi:hypothetical protein